MEKTCLIAMILSLCLLGSIGCERPEKSPEESKREVVAEVNGQAIYLSELEEQLKNVAPGGRIDPRTTVGQRSVLETMINRKLLFQEAEKAGIPRRPDVQAMIKIQDEQIILNRLIDERVGRGAEVSDEEARRYYELNRGIFSLPERRRMRHLVVAEEGEARQLREKLLKGADFAQLVTQYSLPDWKTQSGDLGYLERSAVIPELGEAAFNLKLKEYSQPVKTQFGYHVIEVLDIQKPRQIRFEEARDEIRRLLTDQKRNTLLTDWINDLRARSNIDIRGTVLTKLLLEYEVAAPSPSPAGTEEAEQSGD